MSARQTPTEPSAATLRAAFASARALTVGIEDELLVLDGSSLALVPRAPDVLARLDGDARFKLELPASQIEIVTAPSGSVPEAAAALAGARADLAALGAKLGLRFAGAGVHPFSPGVGKLNQGERYEHTFRAYGSIARRQLVCGLQVHVAVGDAELALLVYNAARSFLPVLAALAANAPFYEGHDTGLASVRPKLCDLLPRQGVPPALGSWEEFADALRWGRASGAFSGSHAWWWELRPHPRFGTLEFRVPDGQATVGDAAAVAAVAQALVAWLSERAGRGEHLPVVDAWRIEENRWSACRDGIGGTMADLRTGEVRPTRVLLLELIQTLAPLAARLGSASALEHARELVASGGGAAGQRAAAAGTGPVGAARWLAERFAEPVSG